MDSQVAQEQARNCPHEEGTLIIVEIVNGQYFVGGKDSQNRHRRNIFCTMNKPAEWHADKKWIHDVHEQDTNVKLARKSSSCRWCLSSKRRIGYRLAVIAQSLIFRILSACDWWVTRLFWLRSVSELVRPLKYEQVCLHITGRPFVECVMLMTNSGYCESCYVSYIYKAVR